MTKILKTNVLVLITLLIANPATLLPMESQPTAQENSAMEIEQTCSLCTSELPNSEFRQLSCGHRFCADCLKDLLRLGLDEEWAQSMATHLRCPQQGCPHQMNEADIQHITSDNARVARYRDILTALFFNANRTIRHCPTAACEVIYEIDFRPETVTCRSCNATYCSYCRQPHERGIACSDAHAAQTATTETTNANISAEELQERQYQTWLRKNTKPCPKCNVNIQKNEGCKHMTCRMCKHEYCWDCAAPWNRRTHPDYYQCSATQQLANGNPAHQRITFIDTIEEDLLRIVQQYRTVNNDPAPNAPRAFYELLIAQGAHLHQPNNNNVILAGGRLNPNSILERAQVNLPNNNNDHAEPLPLLGMTFQGNHNQDQYGFTEGRTFGDADIHMPMAPQMRLMAAQAPIAPVNQEQAAAYMAGLQRAFERNQHPDPRNQNGDQ